MRKGIAQSSKTAWVYILDRETGKPLIGIGKIFTPYWDKPVVYRRQMAVNWSPSSYDPERICTAASVSRATARKAWAATAVAPRSPPPRKT
jgi:hypothetical protein